MNAMLREVPVDDRIRELFSRPRLVNVREHGKWPVFEQASLMAVDMRSRTVVFWQWTYHDQKTHPMGHWGTRTEKTFALDNITWEDFKR